jgi:hypothetical protein
VDCVRTRFGVELLSSRTICAQSSSSRCFRTKSRPRAQGGRCLRDRLQKHPYVRRKREPDREPEEWEIQRQSGSKYESTRLNDIFCVKREDGERRALVITKWVACIDLCASIGIAQLFELRSGQPVITQQFVFDAHADGTGATFNDRALALTVTGRSDDGSPACCARSLDVVTYQWRGNEFKQASYERIPVPESPVLITLQYDRFRSNTSFSTCLVVFRDGRFEMGQALTDPNSGIPKFFEDSLPEDSLDALHAILESQQLEELAAVETPRVGISEGEILTASIYRRQGKQSIYFTAVEAPKGPAPTSFPATLDPLVQWIQATSKDIKHRKLPPLKNVRSSGSCWPEENQQH